MADKIICNSCECKRANYKDGFCRSCWFKLTDLEKEELRGEPEITPEKQDADNAEDAEMADKPDNFVRDNFIGEPPDDNDILSEEAIYECDDCTGTKLVYWKENIWVCPGCRNGYIITE